LACDILASLGPRSVYKDMLNNVVSPIDHVVMNHQNQTRTNGKWGHVRYKVPKDYETKTRRKEKLRRNRVDVILGDGERGENYKVEFIVLDVSSVTLHILCIHHRGSFVYSAARK
jgi:hypothetical protein